MGRRLTPLLVAVAALAAGCSTDSLTVPNITLPTPDGLNANPRSAATFLGNGILARDRSAFTGFISTTGQLGRESFSISLTEGRGVTDVYQNFFDPARGTSGNWGNYYQVIRDINNLRKLLPNAAFTDAERAGLGGFLDTEEAIQLHFLVAGRNALGIPVTVDDDPAVTSPFVSRDSAYAYIANTLDAGYAKLTTAGAALPFTMAAGFTGYNAPATYARYNRMLKARVQVWRASLLLGAAPTFTASGAAQALYNDALTAITAVGAVSMTLTGPQGVYSTAANEATNPLYVQNGAQGQYANPWINSDPDVSHTDRRYLAYFVTAAAAQPTNADTNGVKITTTTKIGRWPLQAQSIPYFTGAELILLRAEALYFTGGDALTDINTIRQTDGTLAARGAFVDANDFVTELLAQRRLSMSMLGHRWIDHRRFGLLSLLPNSGDAFRKTANMVVPQAECLARALPSNTGGPCPAYTPLDAKNQNIL